MLDLFVEIAAGATDLADAWRVLVAKASTNVFMNPAAVAAAEGHGYADPRVLAAWDRSGAVPALIGVWAMQATRPLPFGGRVLSLPPYDYAFVSSPVIDHLNTDVVAAGFFGAIAANPALPKVLRMRYLDAGDETYAAILRALAARGAHTDVISRRQRAYADRATGLKKSGSTRKKLRQDWNRLAAEGDLVYRNRRDAADVREDFEAFLALEAASWKGENRTALLSSAEDACFARKFIANLAAEGNASVAMLTLDGKPIATQVLLYSGATAYTWKTAFDGAHAKHSPGAVLIDKAAEDLFTNGDVAAIESCSPDGGFMEQLWSGRRETVDLLVDLSGRKSFTFRAVSAWAHGRNALKRARDRFRKQTKARTPAKAAAPALS
jgi:CelD/BcsL family acetyltransferase involved in cellulose biosynthesis